MLPSLGLGGAERQAYYFARYLRDHVHADAELLSLSPDAAMADICRASGVPYSFFEPKHGYRSRVGQARDLLRFARLLRRRRVDVLLPYCMFQNVLCGLTWRASGARVCIWNQRDEGRSRLEPWIERLAVRQTPRFISNSTHGAAFVVNELGVPSRQVAIVPNGIVMPSPAVPQRLWRQELGLPDGAFVASMVANLHAKKDHATLITAWRHVVDQLATTNRAAHLLLAGALDDTYQDLVRQVNELSLDAHVHFLGQIQPVDDLLRSVDLSVFSSFNEGIPNSVLEAMSHGLAVVATDYPGIREALGPEGTPLLARPRDARHLAELILMAASDPTTRGRLGAQGKRRAAESFSVESMASAMTSIISSEWLRSTARA